VSLTRVTVPVSASPWKLEGHRRSVGTLGAPGGRLPPATRPRPRLRRPSSSAREPSEAPGPVTACVTVMSHGSGPWPSPGVSARAGCRHRSGKRQGPGPAGRAAEPRSRRVSGTVLEPECGLRRAAGGQCAPLPRMSESELLKPGPPAGGPGGQVGSGASLSVGPGSDNLKSE
jgi:hypothetical protein